MQFALYVPDPGTPPARPHDSCTTWLASIVISTFLATAGEAFASAHARVVAAIRDEVLLGCPSDADDAHTVGRRARVVDGVFCLREAKVAVRVESIMRVEVCRLELLYVCVYVCVFCVKFQICLLVYNEGWGFLSRRRRLGCGFSRGSFRINGNFILGVLCGF